MLTNIGFILAAAALCLLLVTLLRSVLPAIAGEESFTPPVAAWVDVWLPLILTAPFVIALSAARNIGETARFEVWYAATPVTIATALSLGLILIARSSRGFHNVTVFSLRQAGVLSLLGMILALSSLGDQFTFQHGQMFLLAAILWLWMSSPALTEQKRAEKIETGSRRPQLILDWAGSLESQISNLTKVLILLSLTGFWLAVRTLLPQQLTGAIAVAAAFEVVTAIGIWCRLGRAAAQRCLISTMIFTVLFGLGSMAFTRLGANLTIIFDPEYIEPLGPLVISGMSSLRATGMLLLGLGIIAFIFTPTIESNTVAIPEKARAPRAICTGLLLIVGAFLLFMTANRTLLNEARDRVYEFVVPILHPNPPADVPTNPTIINEDMPPEN